MKIKVEPATLQIWKMIMADHNGYGFVKVIIQKTGLSRSTVNEIIDRGYGSEDNINKVNLFMMTLQVDSQDKLQLEVAEKLSSYKGVLTPGDFSEFVRYLRSSFYLKRISS